MNPSIPSPIRALLSAALIMAIAPAMPAGAAGQQDSASLADTVPMAVNVPAAEPRPAQPVRAITRIVLTADELPSAVRAQSAYAAQPAGLQRAPVRQLERDAITLRAARAAMLQNDASHQQQRLAALR
ncbi:hypothetical protein ASC94_03810 [Massilia sp. Root418]|uniref:hypothetical protein n=1 Tax=Massilia sp. Root418 TaxID=1736532 RepID=UPI0006F55C28|nr:hypothetical protein [Massilia sp. Root418]KQX01739.1 hypothetical protein ASC94_03810 [Massilia sp. Root418]